MTDNHSGFTLIETIAHTPVLWVGNLQELEQMCQQIDAEQTLYVDTEFFRERTYWAKPALLQIFDGRHIYLLDWPQFPQSALLKDLLCGHNADILLHSGSEDLELFAHCFGTPIAGYLDTQIAAGLVGYRAGIGYAELVQTVCGEELDKSQTRSNWLKRPLSDRQLHYAALDVYYLRLIWQHLLDKLQSKDRLAWLKQSCAPLNSPKRVQPTVELAVNKMRFAPRMSPQGRA